MSRAEHVLFTPCLLTTWLHHKGAMEKGIFAMENIQPPSCEVLVEEKENAGSICTKKPIGAVVCGFDPRLNYFKIQSAQLCLSEKYGGGEDCKFIATNPDAVAHITPDQEWAGNGCCVGAIKGYNYNYS